jgi:integrase
MSGAAMPFKSRIERFLVERRGLGFSARGDACTLRSLARHLHETGHCGALTLEVMADWARRDSHGSTDPVTWARRLKRLRTFVRWLQQFEPDTEVPDDTIFGRISERKAPHIYSEQEIIDLLASARRLGPPGSLRGIVFETLFGLIASTGLRISEALSLKNADVDLKTGMLSIHLSKFGKSRQVPVHASTLDALRRYRSRRDSPRVVRRGQRSSSAAGDGCVGRLGDRQVHRVFAELRRQLGCPIEAPPCGAHPRPAAHLRRQAHRAVAGAERRYR